MKHEIETKVLDVDVTDVRERLSKLKAEKTGETRLVVDWYRLKGVIEGEDPWFLRIRSNSEGKHEVTWKADPKVLGISRTCKEINFIVNDPIAVGDFFSRIGLEHYAHQEKSRVSFSLQDWLIEIDTYPKMPPFLEIEGASEQHVRKALELLGLSANRTWAEGERTLIQQEFGLDWYDMRF